jgi:hypothetical protein
MTLSTEFSLTAEEEALLPSDDDVRFYAEHGWYLSGKLFSDDEVDALVAASDDYYDGARDRRLPSRPAKLAYWQPEHGQVQRHNDYVHYESDAIARILRKPLLGAVAARLAGADEIRIFQSTMIYKPPVASEPTNVVPWHFDKHYWSCCTSNQMLTAFIPFHDCGVEMGTITMVDGSHRWRETGTDDSTVRHFAERDKAQLDVMLAENAAFNGAEVVKVPIEIPKGHMSFHHCHLSRQRPERQRPAAPGHLAAPAGRRERLPGIPALGRHAGRLQPRQPGEAHRRGPPRLLRSGVLPDAVARVRLIAHLSRA